MILERSELMLSLGAKNWGEGERRAASRAQRAPRPRALAQSLNCCEALTMGEGGVSGACAPRVFPMVRTRRAARHGAARTFERAQKARARKGMSKLAKRGTFELGRAEAASVTAPHLVTHN
jgi:hypothetical protein